MTSKGKRHTLKREDVIETIIRMRIKEGATYLIIMDWITKDVGYAMSYAYELIRDAKKEINERSIINFGEDLKEDIERFEALYNKCLEVDNKREARENLKEIAKLKGHYVERTDITSNGKDITEIKLIHINGKDAGDKND